MSDNNQNEIKETWKEKSVGIVGALIVFAVFRLLGRTFGFSIIFGLFGGYYVYKYILETKNAAISVFIGLASAFFITLIMFNIISMLFR
tara:strand:+ start:58 stop:324 length:267 start_codon:yes stop_codon:yes gene_type:complete